MPRIDIILTIGIILLLLIVTVLFLGIRKNEKDREKNSVFLKKNPKKKNVLIHRFYEFLSNFFITSRFMRRIRKNQEFLYPGDDIKIVRNTMKMVEILVSILILAFIFLVTQQFSFYGNSVFIITVYFGMNEVVYYLLERKQISLLSELEQFITAVRHYYFEHEMVDEAIDEAVQEAGPLMKLHGQKIYDVITSPDPEGESIIYNETVPNRFLRTLLGNCTTVMTYGDNKVEGESLFLSNLRDLKRELSIERRKREKLNFIFSGLIILCLVPLYFMPGCSSWCISNIPSLLVWYSSSNGIYVQIAIFAIAILCYHLLRHMKEGGSEFKADHPILDYFISFTFIANLMNAVTGRNYGKTLRLKNTLRRTGAGISVEKFYVKRFLCAICTFIIAIGILFYGHELDKYNYINNPSINDDVTNAMTDSDYQMLEPTIVKYAKQNKHLNMSVEQLKNQIQDAGVFRFIDSTETAANITYNQIKQYQNEYFRWYDILIALAVAIIAFWLPYLTLHRNEKNLLMQMDDEVIQFQSVILMLIHMPNVTVELLLEWMCNFAVIFKPSLMECIDNYSYGDKDALEKLLEEETHVGFQRIVKNLLACDRIGVEAAFTEISSDRLNYQEARKQENEIVLEKKETLATKIAMLPFMAVLILYLIVPFLYGALAMYSDMSSIFQV